MKEKAKYPRKSAVALRYNLQEAEAPRVIAKGKGLVADKIIEQAKENGIPVQEDPSLVQVLAGLELNEQIPVELYQVVAELLAFVYQTDRKSRPS
ncbi:EscU/YscU/HrcU family type III secretion system export apparatus switch protein [Aneurinibacillus uraniidurans]|uniref:EscU/YscU/HrcU family type III secretion system export apparatus switch protein n=1 Tax=Aneurinibacillus uraniidurans TaxID=2966586 RepID=UPI002349B388|nr:EscU/YscU/HrcU family type III secretion system export apparatus switch protein [Aneurinibacillus sp. B1]WCN39075.1 EscU/YscU/HrcU family type III secretion system export apparatus switch protein [Aneurinibacillus sp. B1]